MAGCLAILGDSVWSDLIAHIDMPSGWPVWWSAISRLLSRLPSRGQARQDQLIQKRIWGRIGVQRTSRWVCHAWGSNNGQKGHWGWTVEMTRKCGQMRVMVKWTEGGRRGEGDVKNSGNLQKAKRVCGWRGVLQGEVGRRLVRYGVQWQEMGVWISICWTGITKTCSFM